MGSHSVTILHFTTSSLSGLILVKKSSLEVFNPKQIPDGSSLELMEAKCALTLLPQGGFLRPSLHLLCV